MPDFVATYQISGLPPQGWKEQLEKFAADSGLKASASIVGKQAVIQCQVPENSAETAGALAKAFFDEASVTLTEGGSGKGVRLMSIEPTQRSTFLSSALAVLDGGWWLIGIGAIGTTLVAGMDPKYLPIVMIGVIWALAGVVLLFGERMSKSRKALDETQRAADLRLEQALAKDEDPKLTTRIEAARVSLRMRAGRMRKDADDLRDRSVWAYRSALFFFLLAIAGPGVAATLLLRAGTLDWHLMFGGFGLAAVPLTIGTALLRHDTKLREQYREAARDVATLERYELALDYARIGAQPSYDATLQQVITQLLTLPPATLGTAPTAPSSKEDVESHAAITAVATKLVDAVTTTLGQKK
jgi:hypothetical protein